MTATQARTPPRDLTHPVTVLVEDHGNWETRTLDIHPLALTIPAASEADFERLRADIDERGVNEPIVLFEGKILDGRHRALIAAERTTPINVRDFTGTEEEARAYVWSANAVRRHLSQPQLGTLALAYFGSSVPTENGGVKTRPVNRSGRATTPTRHATPRHQEIARRAGDVVSPGMLQRLELGRVADAPRTMERIESGAIRRIDQAVREAAVELGTEVPAPLARSAWDRLGCAAGDIRAANKGVQEGNIGVVSRAQVIDRCRTLQRELERIVRIAQMAGGRQA